MTLPSFASITVHEKVDDLVDGVLLLEHDEVLPASTRSFQSIFVYFFGHNLPGIRIFHHRLKVSEGLLSLPVLKSKFVRFQSCL